MSNTAYAEEIKTLTLEIERQRNESIKFRRTLEDLLYNLEPENMPQVAKVIETYKSETANSMASVEAIANDALARVGLVVEKDIYGRNAVRASVIVEAINDTSSVTIAANKINLNGAVTANNNFKINTNGSVECRDITITGGEIHIPTPPRSSTPILSVSATDNSGSVGLFANRVEFQGGSVVGEFDAKTSLDNVKMHIGVLKPATSSSNMEYTADLTARRIVIAGTEKSLSGDEIEESDLNSTFDATTTYLRHSYIAAHPRQSSAGLRQLYIDSNGYIYAVV